MSQILIRIPLAFLMVAGIPGTLAAWQSNVSMSASDVIDNFIEALGGEMSIRGHGSITIEGTLNYTMVMPKDGPEVTMDGTFIHKARDGKVLMTTNLKDLDDSIKIVQGFDGSKYWIVDPGSTEKRVADKSQSVWMNSMLISPQQVLIWKEAAVDMELETDVSFKDKAAARLTFHFADDRVARHHFDLDSGLLLGTEINEPAQRSLITYQYLQREGIKYFARLHCETMTEGDIRVDYEILPTRFDDETELDDSVFAGPEDQSPASTDK